VTLIVIFVLVISFFLFASPVLAVLYLGVAYTFLSRSSSLPAAINKPPTPPTPPTLIRQTPPVVAAAARPPPRTLEEDVISNMAPVGGQTALVQTSFRPVADNVNGASPVTATN
jgi:hypothetical protein